MKKICLLRNCIQEYAWGSRTAIPSLLGEINASGKPMAECWMGAHPKAPSRVFYRNDWVPLDRLIREDPLEILGRETAEKFNNMLPYLFKVLAAEKPLSIQAHPSRIRAKQGFDRETFQNIPMDSSNRNYRDPNHKPECICALTTFWALNGFRPISEIVRNMDLVFPDLLRKEKKCLLSGDHRQGLKMLMHSLMAVEEERKETFILSVLTRLYSMTETSPMVEWIIRLHRDYPTDMGIFSPVYLNLVCLEPGQAMFLPAGELHAYLEGMGIEVMANSDNVLRGGLTPKYVDIDELFRVLNFTERRVRILSGDPISETENIYKGDADEFLLSRIVVKQGKSYSCSGRRSMEILLWTSGRSTVRTPEEGEELEVFKGTSVMIPASVQRYDIIGDAEIFKVCVPL